MTAKVRKSMPGYKAESTLCIEIEFMHVAEVMPASARRHPKCLLDSQ
jgi:hypothetical protein